MVTGQTDRLGNGATVLLSPTSPEGPPRPSKYQNSTKRPDANDGFTELSAKGQMDWGYNEDQYREHPRGATLRSALASLRVNFMTIDVRRPQRAPIKPITKLKVRQAVIMGDRPRQHGSSSSSRVTPRCWTLPWFPNAKSLESPRR